MTSVRISPHQLECAQTLLDAIEHVDDVAWDALILPVLRERAAHRSVRAEAAKHCDLRAPRPALRPHREDKSTQACPLDLEPSARSPHQLAPTGALSGLSPYIDDARSHHPGSARTPKVRQIAPACHCCARRNAVEEKIYLDSMAAMWG